MIVDQNDDADKNKTLSTGDNHSYTSYHRQNFFYDRQFSEYLRKTLIIPLIQQHESGALRVWVPNCTTGEEAYSLTVLFVDELLRLNKNFRLQIFATDTNQNLLTLARTARYPARAISRIDSRLLQQFFTEEDHFYQIDELIRSKVTFAIQNPLSDPPFARLHLISCRNLLNTLARQQQDRLIEVFHFALNPDGYLILGHATGRDLPVAQFSLVSKKWRIYQHNGSGWLQPVVSTGMASNIPPSLIGHERDGLRAANENTMLFNEELQAFNEELEAAREELQTLNEELLNTNHQLKLTNHDQQTVNEDLNNLLINTGIATLLLDRDLNIRRYTPAVTRLIRMISTDIGRPLKDITTCFAGINLSADIAKTLQNAASSEKEIRSTAGDWYLCRIVPYITGDHRLDGAVVTFIDITTAKLDTLRQEFLLKFYDVLRPLQEPDDIIFHAAHLTGEFFHAARCAYGVVDSLHTTVTIDHDYGGDDDIVWSGDYRLDDWDADILHELLSGRPLQIEDGDSDNRLQRIACTRFATGDLRSLLLVPHNPDQKMGMLFAIGHRQPRVWRPEEVDLLKQMLERTWLALERAKADQALRETRQQLEQQTQQLLEDERHKNEFLSILGHELRNPLAAVRNTLTVLELKSGSEQKQSLSAVLDRQMRHMQRLIDDLLDISRINAGKIELVRQPIRLADCVGTAVETLQPMLDASGHKLEISLPSQTLWLNGDPVRLAQILENLLTNAVKYSGHGSRIRLTAEQRQQSIVIRIGDNGVGISAEELHSIFKMFNQSREAVRHSRNGLGLGLALVKQLVELHDGTVQAFSEGPGCGSEFVVTLALASAPETAPDSGGMPTASRFAAGVARRVLIIDDNVDNADSLVALLTALGHQVSAIYTGTTALTTVHRFEPDYVFIDISMPDMDGFEVAQQLRGDYASGTLMLIALSGYGSDEDIGAARAAGFDHYLLKPVSIEEVNSVLAAKPQAVT